MQTDPPGWKGLEPTDSSRWSVTQRLEFIENTLYWRGRINRSDLVNQYQISLPQASGDLQKYLEIAEDGVSYDSSAKAYTATPLFRPKLTKPNADRFLLQMLGWRRGILHRSEFPPQDPPPFDELPVPRRVINPDVLRAVTKAITTHRKISVHYQSMTRPGPTWRDIAPHSLAFDRQRWHVRAYCYEREAFRDFVLTRIFDVKDIGTSEIPLDADISWNTHITVKIAPHPDLTDDQKKAIEIDYGMQDSTAALTVRAAMLFYLMRAMRWTGKSDRPAIEQQVIVTNRSEVEKAMKQFTPDFRST
jgi:hypothetical protein